MYRERERLLLMIIITRLIISTYLNSGSKRPSRSRGTIASTVSFLLLRLPTLVCLLFGRSPCHLLIYPAFPRSLDSLFQKRFLQIWSREHISIYDSLLEHTHTHTTITTVQPYLLFITSTTLRLPLLSTSQHGRRQSDFPTWA